MSFSTSKEVQDAMQHYLKASNLSSKFHQYFFGAQIDTSTNLNSKLETNIDNKSVSSNDSHSNEHPVQSLLVSKRSNRSTSNISICHRFSNLKDSTKYPINNGSIYKCHTSLNVMTIYQNKYIPI